MNCKPGDLAYIVASQLPENIGRAVEVLHPSEPILEAPAWIIRVTGRPLAGLDDKGNVGYAQMTRHLDSCLRPITGPSATDDTETEIVRPAPQLVEVLA